ncbi:hypothetical protein NA57DRAFT_7371, partial [Rhizodiscina lignyota]
RAKSCTRCRQAKLACDARKTLNGPCSRCKSKGLDCRFDAKFKRVSTRRLATEISHELHALRSAEEPFSLHSTQNLETVPENENKALAAEAEWCSTNLPEHALSWLDTMKADVACSYTLGKVQLEAQCAIELFQYPLGSGRDSNGWPGFGLVAEGAVKMTDQAQTWLGCFRVGTAVATFSGLPLPISTQQHMRSIDKALQTTSNMTPSWWTALFSILKTTNSITATLENIEDHALHFSVTQMFSEQLDKLKRECLASWRPELEIEWCNAKLYLFALTFTTPANADPSQDTQIRIHRQMILQKASEVASNLITQFVKLGQLGASESHPGGLLKFVPELYLTSLFNATTFLFRFMATFMTRTPAQGSQAMGLIIEAHKIFQSYPAHREFTRAAIHIEALIGILKQGAPVGMSELAVKNKLGASVMFDAIFHACRQRNIDPSTGRPLAVREWRTVNETFAQRLPEAPTIKTQSNVRGVDSGKNTLESDQQFMVSGGQTPRWWEEWDNYIDLFQVGEEQLDM